jgi:transcriptional regulator of acetoin/glycerol metabolism
MSLQPRAVQVLALARAPLFAQVIDGRFSSELYYRLNTVLVEVREQADLPVP